MVGEREYTSLRAAEPERNKFTVISREPGDSTIAANGRADLPDPAQDEEGAPALSLGLGLALALRLKL